MMAAKDSTAEVSATGAFTRSPSTLRSWVRADGSTEYTPDAGRYILYISYACPWACRCAAVRHMKGLKDVIELAVVSPLWQHTKPDVDEHRGWVFDPSFPGATADPVFHASTLREFYEKAGGGAVTKFTVPVLFDRKTMSIVNNESSEIIRMFNSEFNAVSTRPGE